MTRPPTCPLSLFVALIGSALFGPARASCTAFTIQHTATDITVESIMVDEGQTLVFASDESFISLVVPVAVGQSADLVRRDDSATLIARCEADTLHVLVKRGELTREVLSRAMRELSTLTVRLGITTGSGARARWRIDRWATAAREDGPVIDLFAGRIPLGPNDVSITTEVGTTTTPAAQSAFTGTAPIRFEDGYPITDLEVAGVRLRAVVDLAAASSILARRALPKDFSLHAATMQEHSGAGTRVLPLAVGGAGGSVVGLSEGTLSSLQFGTARLSDVSVLVMDTLPAVGGKPLDGIIGLDLLQPAGAVRFTRATVGTGATWSLQFAPKSANSAPSSELVLRAAGALWGVDATVSGARAFLILDTGSARSVVSTRVASQSQMKLESGDGPAPHGLDGAALTMRSAKHIPIQLERLKLDIEELRVADLPVLAKFAATGGIGLLGADLVQQLSSFEVDFTAQRLRLWK